MFNNTPVTQPTPIVVAEELSIVAILFIIIGVLIGLAIGIALIIIPRCKMFKKAGYEWWKALIPVYSTWIEQRIGGLAWWWFPIYVGLTIIAAKGTEANYVALWGLFLADFNIYFNMVKKFKKSNGVAVLCTFLPFIGYPILGYGKAEYHKDVKVDPNGIFSIEK